MRTQTVRALIVGTLTGVFSGLTGVGGGALLVALMVSQLGLTQHIAQGTTPAVIIPVAIIGAATYAVQGLNGQFYFDWQLALAVIPALTLPGMFGVVIGATWMNALPSAQLKRAFGVFLFFVALSMLSKGILPIGTPTGTEVDVPFIFWILLGFVTGVFAGFLGIGGAIMLVPFMSLGAGIPQHMSQGITLAVVALTSIAGTMAQYRLGHVNTEVVKAMSPSAVVAVFVASLMAGQLDGFWLTKIFGLAMLYFAYQFTFVSPRQPELAESEQTPQYYTI